MDTIRVYTLSYIQFSDLPNDISELVHEVCCEWGIGSGEHVFFENVLEYYEDNDEKSNTIKEFMNKNDLDDEIAIDCDW